MFKKVLTLFLISCIVFNPGVVLALETKENDIQIKEVKEENFYKNSRENIYSEKSNNSVYKNQEDISATSYDDYIKKINGIIKDKHFSNYYSRTYFSKGAKNAIKILATLSFTKAGALKYIATKIGISLESLLAIIHIYSGFDLHDFDSPSYVHYLKMGNGINYNFHFKEGTTKWINHTVTHYITDSYPKEKEYYGPYWYYIENDEVLGANGKMWNIISNKWYQFDKYGRLVQNSGWIKYNNKWMYFIPNNFGAYRDTWEKIDGRWYQFNSDGYLIEKSGWIKYNDKWMYFIPNSFGACTNETRLINGVYYSFDKNGYLID